MPDLLAGVGVGHPFAFGPVGSFFFHLRLALDVDAPACEARRKACVLAFFADRQAELVVGHDDCCRAGLFVDANFLHLCWAKCFTDKVLWVVVERHDVDLFATQLVDHHAHPGAPSTNARTSSINVGIVGPHSNLGAMSRFTSHCLDFDDAVVDFWNFEFEQPLDQPWVSAADHNLGALGALANFDDIGLEARTVLVTFAHGLLCLRQQRFDATQVEQRVAVVLLLDDAGDDVALAACVFLVLQVAFDLTDSLQDDLFGGLGSNAAEFFRRVVPFADDLTVFVEFLRVDPHLARVGVDRHHGLFGRIRKTLICGDQRIC